ncbi:MAG TPA: ABC transporter permease [Gemmatimonadaceae bacterium]|nr:ABC transporter permease [Gemmatimonadaceae bacterium]
MKRLFRLSDSRPDPERDVDEEIRFHLEMRAQEFIERGLAPEAARQAALESFGDVAAIEAECRTQRNRRTGERARRERLHRIVLDTICTLRGLRKHRGFTFATVLTLALGIGSATAVFSVVDRVLIHPLPYPEPDRLVSVFFTAPGLGYDAMPLSDVTYRYLREGQRSLDDMVLVDGEDMNLSAEGEPVRVRGARVTPGFLRLLRVKPLVGRAFTAADGEPGAKPVAILSHELWKSSFGAEPGVIGRSVTIDGVTHRVVGVAPRGIELPDPTTRIWVPFTIDPAHLNPGLYSFLCFARLARSETLASATTDLQRLVAHIDGVVPAFTPEFKKRAHLAAVVQPLAERTVGDLRRPLWIIFGTGAFVLLIACANVANLFLVRAESRGRELALRTALGASRSDVAGLILGESLVLALSGGALGLLLAVAGVKALLALSPATIPGAQSIGVDSRLLLFTLTVSIVVGLAFGSVPLLRRRSTELSTALKGSGRAATSGRDRGRTRNALVSVQVALALVLLVGAGLMVRSFRALRHVDPGFRADGVLTFEVALSRNDHPSDIETAVFWRELTERMRALPGARSAAVTTNLPLAKDFLNGGIEIESRAVPDGGVTPTAELKYVSSGYFETLGIPVLQGRALDAHDAANGFRGVVVNRAFARQWWPNGEALGARIRQSSSDPWYEIVGIVGDVRFRSLDQEPGAAVYFPILSGAADSPDAPRHVAVAVRGEGDLATLATVARAQLRTLDAHLPIANLQPLQSLVNRSMARTSFVLVLLGIAAALALLLGMVGIYGVIAYLVSQRRREIGVRMALGATARDVRGMVVRQGLVLAALGAGAGLVAALALSRLMASLLYGVGANDLTTFAAVLVALLGVAALASYLPARRASAIDPTEALREE